MLVCWRDNRHDWLNKSGSSSTCGRGLAHAVMPSNAMEPTARVYGRAPRVSRGRWADM